MKDKMQPSVKLQRYERGHIPPLRLQGDKERKGEAMKDCQQDIFPYNNWPNPVQRRENSVTASRKIYSEASKRRLEKHDRSKLEYSDTDSKEPSRERGETNCKSLNEYQILHQDERRLYENEIRLTKGIHKRKILLEEKLLNAAERVRKLQLSTASEDQVKEEQKDTGKAENRLYYTGKGNWDWEIARDRAVGGRRHERREEGSNCVRVKDGIKRQETRVKETNASQKEKLGEETEWENRGRNTQRTTRTVEKEWDHFEEMTRHKTERVRTEKDQTRRERAMDWQMNEMREWDQRDWQEEEKERVKYGEKRRREQAKLKRDIDMDNEDQQWDLTDNFASNSHIKMKAVSIHLATPERVHHYSNRVEKEMPRTMPPSEAAPSTQNGKMHQEVQLSPESSPYADVQLVPCTMCKRRMRGEILDKHIRLHHTNKKPTRKAYTMSEYRAKGTELEKFLSLKDK
ncbi:hypothetical protein AMELA_G00126550 [Ameiurus melas]|uniref:Uncharacterized protein n=1 Tax=Ameiurus melas TaxID=219545 RepID=A0A7J6AQK3_AMEME|nr:hypothetical protein AMELA_G00126550 [Ameiurus melas]